MNKNQLKSLVSPLTDYCFAYKVSMCYATVLRTGFFFKMDFHLGTIRNVREEWTWGLEGWGWGAGGECSAFSLFQQVFLPGVRTT